MVMIQVFLGYELDIPSGKLLHNYGKIHHFQWDLSTITKWSFSIAM